MSKNPFFIVDGEEHCDEEAALADLLAQEIVFSNERDYLGLDGEKAGSTVVLYVNCNDIFAWACADAEDLPHDEIGTLWRMSQEPWGSAKWCCRRRQQKPQPPVIEEMKKAAVWDAEMEALPDNWEDAQASLMFRAIASQMNSAQGQAEAEYQSWSNRG